MGYGFYGHGSWVVLAFLAVAVLTRSLRGRGRGSRRAPGTSRQGPFASGFEGSPQHPAPTTRTAGGDIGAGRGVRAGWFPDPSARHEQRYWSGSEWTEHVMSNGVPGVSPPPGRSGAEVRPSHEAPAEEVPPADGDAPGPGPG